MSSEPVSSNSNKTFTLDPNDNLTRLTTYKTRVTTGVKDTAGNTMSSQYETSSGFTVPDTTAPANPGIIINGGDNVAYSDNVTLSLSATDAVGVTGYYASENSTVSTSGWSIVDSATTFSDNVSFTLSSANDNKTVYVWFKDTAGNVSSSASDNITKSPPTVIISRTGQDQSTGNSYTTNNLEWQIATAAKNDGLSNGLTWYYNAKLYWDDAVSYCNNLELAGQTDWRLPTKFELISLIEDQNPGPKIDSRLYATTPSSTVPPSNPWSEYWSSTTQNSNNVYVYYVDFGIGQEWYLQKTGVLPLFVRCVRP
jgi:hypothetical protein